MTIFFILSTAHVIVKAAGKNYVKIWHLLAKKAGAVRVCCYILTADYWIKLISALLRQLGLKRACATVTFTQFYLTNGTLLLQFSKFGLRKHFHITYVLVSQVKKGSKCTYRNKSLPCFLWDTSLDPDSLNILIHNEKKKTF